MSDLISRQAAINSLCSRCVVNNPGSCSTIQDGDNWCEEVFALMQIPAEPKRIWHPVETPPTHHRDVIVRGIEAIGNVTVHRILQWDVDTWRPKNYAPSISWKEWSEIDE